MNVEHILMAKGRDVLTIEPSRTLADAARALTEKQHRRRHRRRPRRAVLGILSERDIVRALARGGAAALERAGSQHMTGKVVTCTRQTDHQRAHGADDRSGKFRHMPVVEDGRLCGIISIGDVVKHRARRDRGRDAGHARVYRDRLSL